MHLKQWHYSLHRDFQNCYSTRRSPTGFFSSNSNSNLTRASTYNLHVHITLQRILHPIPHAEDKSSSSTTTTFQRAKRPSFQKRNSTHRRQGDLLEMHPCVTRTFQAFPPQDLPKALQLLQTFQSFQTFQTFQSFMTFQPFQAILQILQCSSISRESTPFQHSPIRMNILHIL